MRKLSKEIIESIIMSFDIDFINWYFNKNEKEYLIEKNIFNNKPTWKDYKEYKTINHKIGVKK